jgi:hypothetical protein
MSERRPFEALQITYELERAMPREVVERMAEATAQLWRLMDDRVPDTPENRAAALAEVAAALDEARARVGPVLLSSRRIRDDAFADVRRREAAERGWRK